MDNLRQKLRYPLQPEPLTPIYWVPIYVPRFEFDSLLKWYFESITTFLNTLTRVVQAQKSRTDIVTDRHRHQATHPKRKRSHSRTRLQEPVNFTDRYRRYRETSNSPVSLPSETHSQRSSSSHTFGTAHLEGQNIKLKVRQKGTNSVKANDTESDSSCSCSWHRTRQGHRPRDFDLLTDSTSARNSFIPTPRFIVGSSSSSKDLSVD